MTTTQALPKLSPEQVRFYRENGYIQLRNFLTAEEVAHIIRVMDRAIASQKEAQARLSAEAQRAAETRGVAETLSAPDEEASRKLIESYAKVFEQRVNTWEYDPEMKEVTQDPRFAEVARQLVGCRGIRLFHDHALIKQPGDNKATNWHQDTPYWPMNENGALSIWIALNDVDESNGCLHFIARSRNVDRLEPQLLGPDDVTGGLLEELARPDSEEKTRTRDALAAIKRGEHPELERIMAMPAGSVTFHDGLTLHYANANHTDKPRRALAIIFMPDGTTYNGKGHCMTDDLGLAVGAPLAGERFPLLATGE